MPSSYPIYSGCACFRDLNALTLPLLVKVKADNLTLSRSDPPLEQSIIMNLKSLKIDLI
jgi:hypothetical protein